MNCKATVAFVFILALGVCDADSEREPNFAQLYRRETTEPCGTCNLQKAINESALTAFKAELKILDSTIGTVESSLRNIFNTEFKGVDELKAAIEKNLLEMKAATDNLLDKLSKALAKVDSCPEYQQYMITLKENVGNLLSRLAKIWPKHVTAVDLESRVDSLRLAFSEAIPEIFITLSDTVFYYFQVFEPENCKLFLRFLKPTLDPKGIFARFMIDFFANGGKAANELLKLILGVILPGQEEGSLDLIQLINRLICGVLSIVVYPPDLSATTGGLCPNLPPNVPHFNMARAMTMMICDVLKQLGFDKNPWTVGVYLMCRRL